MKSVGGQHARDTGAPAVFTMGASSPFRCASEAKACSTPWVRMGHGLALCRTRSNCEARLPGRRMDDRYLRAGRQRVQRYFARRQRTDDLHRRLFVDPTWSPDGQFVIYSGPGLARSLRSRPPPPRVDHHLPELALLRGGRYPRYPEGENCLFCRARFSIKTGWSIWRRAPCSSRDGRRRNSMCRTSADGTEVILELGGALDVVV